MKDYNKPSKDPYRQKGMKKDMGHDKSPKKIDVFAAQRADMNRVKNKPMSYDGQPKQAYDYKY